MVCGHRGTVGFASPSYTVSEGNGLLLVTLVRSGGGYGAFEIAYSLEHEGTDEADVTPTAPYTTSQVIPFPEGAVAMTFKVTIHDDRVCIVEMCGWVGGWVPRVFVFRDLYFAPSVLSTHCVKSRGLSSYFLFEGGGKTSSIFFWCSQNRRCTKVMSVSGCVWLSLLAAAPPSRLALSAPLSSPFETTINR